MNGRVIETTVNTIVPTSTGVAAITAAAGDPAPTPVASHGGDHHGQEASTQ